MEPIQLARFAQRMYPDGPGMHEMVEPLSEENWDEVHKLIKEKDPHTLRVHGPHHLVDRLVGHMYLKGGWSSHTFAPTGKLKRATFMRSIGEQTINDSSGVPHSYVKYHPDHFLRYPDDIREEGFRPLYDANAEEFKKTGIQRKSPLQLARGAAVVNNQFYKGGQFIAKALPAIEAAVAKRRGAIQMSMGYGSATNMSQPTQMAAPQAASAGFGNAHLQITPGAYGHHEVQIGHPDAMTVHDHLHNFLGTNKPTSFGFYGNHPSYDTLAHSIVKKHGYGMTTSRTYDGRKMYTFDKPKQLARFDKLPSTRLTPKDLKDVEDAHGKNPPRLPYTVNPDGFINTDVRELHKWFDQIGTRQGKLPKTPKARLAFLVTHFGQAAHQIPDDDWYGDKTKHMEEGFGKAFPKAHKDAVKALVAITSPNQNPHQNIGTVYRMLMAGARRNPDNPVLGIPHRDQDTFNEWVKREGPHAAALKPGFDPQKLLESAAFRGKEPGYSEGDWVMHKATGKITGKVKLRGEGAGKVPEGHTKVKLPVPDAEGNLRPKGWGNYAASQGHLKLIQEKLAELGPDGFSEWMKKNAEKFGPKVGNFYRNLIGDHAKVTKDVWMTRTFRRLMRTIGSAKSETPNASEGKEIDNAVEATAKKMGTTPAKMQALLWYYEQHLHRVFGTKAPSFNFATGIDAAIAKHGIPGQK